MRNSGRAFTGAAFCLASVITSASGSGATVTYTGAAAIKPTTTVAASTTAVPKPTTTITPTGLSSELVNTTTTAPAAPKVLAVTVSTTLPKVADVPAKGLPSTGSNPAIGVLLAGVLLTVGFSLTSTNRRRQLRR
jgi:LPXTG-motif cell wall-anchored protein